MSHILRTAALAVGTCVLLVLPLATPAGAAVVYVHDPPGDGSNGTGGGGPREYGASAPSASHTATAGRG